MMLRHPVLYAYPFGLCGVTLRGAPCEIHIFRFRIAKTAVRVAFHSDRFVCFAAIPFFKRLAFQIFFSVCHFGFLYGLVESVISCWILLPINLITGTAMLLPTALYRGLSGHSAAGLPRHGCGFNAAAQAAVAHFRLPFRAWRCRWLGGQCYLRLFALLR